MKMVKDDTDGRMKVLSMKNVNGDRKVSAGYRSDAAIQYSQLARVDVQDLSDTRLIQRREHCAAVINITSHPPDEML